MDVIAPNITPLTPNQKDEILLLLTSWEHAPCLGMQMYKLAQSWPT